MLDGCFTTMVINLQAGARVARDLRRQSKIRYMNRFRMMMDRSCDSSESNECNNYAPPTAAPAATEAGLAKEGSTQVSKSRPPQHPPPCTTSGTVIVNILIFVCRHDECTYLVMVDTFMVC